MKGISKKTKEIRTFILSEIGKHPNDVTTLTSSNFSISKQAVRKHIQALVTGGYIITSGVTRDKVYKLAYLDKIEIDIPITNNLSEDTIWRENIRPGLEGINSNIIEICQYGFTEMVNNVLDHSEGHNLAIGYLRTAAYLEIIIADDGIGIFNKISSILGLSDEIQVILELAKGKLTTDPQRHTGEGIFFTSRAFDEFMMVSGNLAFAHVETNDDWLLEEQEAIYQGTIVRLRISPFSGRELKDVFDKYSDEENYGFSKTHIPVTLARYGQENLVSRSQAKRMMTRFDRFKEIILDFAGVNSIGQAFADEIFRVFFIDHPEIHINFINTNSQVRNMISRALAGRVKNE